jgi:hypothetical protein
MSYDLQVLRDNPIGYWSFNNTNKDITRYANTATVSGSYVAPPIIANNGYSLKVNNSTTATITNTAGKYECFSNNYQNRTFTIAFWFSLNNQLNGSGAGTYTNDQLTLLSINNGATIIGKIVYDYKSNTVRYVFPGTNNTDSYTVINDLDKQYYIVATYSNGSHSISINAVDGSSGIVNDFSNINSATKSNLSFVISNSSNTFNFLINSIEFYDYRLDIEQIKRHILWAGNDEKPKFQGAISPNTSMFSFSEDQDSLGYSKNISGFDFSNLGKADRLKISDHGLSALTLNTPQFNQNYDQSASYVINTSSGINWSGTAGVDLDFIPEYFNMTTGFTFYMTVNRTSTGSYNEYLFGVSNVNGSNLYLEYDVPDGNTNYYLKMYDPYTGSTTSLISLATGQSASTAKISNIAVEFSGSLISLYTSDNSGLTGSTTITTSLNLNQGSILTVGNSYQSTKNFYSYIDNFGITDKYSGSISSIPFASVSVFLMPFSSSVTPFLVQQRGTWIHQIPSAIIPISNYYGSVFDWKTMDNCQVSYSIDGGNTYNLINRYETASLYNTLGVADNIALKVQIDTDYNIDKTYQYFNNLSYNIYNPLELTSDNEMYTLSASTSSANPNLTISNGTNDILARQENFGLKFSGALPTNALITVPDSSSYSAIEMWYRPDFIPTQTLRTNIIKNPSFEVTPTASMFITYNTNYPVATSTASPLFRTRSLTQSASVSNAQLRIGFHRNNSVTSIIYYSCTPGETYTFSYYIQDIILPASSAVARIRFYNSAASATILSTTTSTSIISTSSYTRVSVTATAPTSPTSSLNGNLIYPDFYCPVNTPSGGYTGGRYLLDGVFLEASPTLNEYFDGSFTGASWSGIADISSSSIVYASPVHIVNNTIDQSISSASITTAPAIYIDNLGKFRSLGGTLYVNGAPVVDGTYSASQNEVYHLTLVLSSPTASNLYLNGGNLVMNSTRSKGTYGYLQFWNTTPTSADILDRYSQFTGKTIYSITDSNTTKLYSASSKESYIITNLG